MFNSLEEQIEKTQGGARLQEDAQSGTSVCLCFPRSYLERFPWPFGWLVEERTSEDLL